MSLGTVIDVQALRDSFNAISFFVPQSAKHWDLQQSIDYKDAYNTAFKLANSRDPNPVSFHESVNSLLEYYK